MIMIDAILDNEGILKSAHIDGHSGFGTVGNDIVCAAVSVLVMAAESTFCAVSAAKTKFKAQKRGEFSIKTDCAGLDLDEKVYLRAAGDFLINGLSAVARDYPKNCSITIRRV